MTTNTPSGGLVTETAKKLMLNGAAIADPRNIYKLVFRFKKDPDSVKNYLRRLLNLGPGIATELMDREENIKGMVFEEMQIRPEIIIKAHNILEQSMFKSNKHILKYWNSVEHSAYALRLALSIPFEKFCKRIDRFKPRVDHLVHIKWIILEDQYHTHLLFGPTIKKAYPIATSWSLGFNWAQMKKAYEKLGLKFHIKKTDLEHFEELEMKKGPSKRNPDSIPCETVSGISKNKSQSAIKELDQICFQKDVIPISLEELTDYLLDMAILALLKGEEPHTVINKNIKKMDGLVVLRNHISPGSQERLLVSMVGEGRWFFYTSKTHCSALSVIPTPA